MLPNCKLTKVGDIQFLIFKNDDLISQRIGTGQPYEPEISAIAEHILAKQKKGKVLDIGANMGTFSVPIARRHPEFEVHAFEPQRIILYQLCANAFINGVENLWAHGYALSDHEEELRLELPDYNKEVNIGAFSINDEVRKNEYECASKSGVSEPVHAIQLDNFVFTDVVLIKIDAEGHELEVLEGAKETIGENGYPPIIFEAWTWKPWFAEKRKEIFALLESWGYNIINIGENNLAQHPDFGEPISFTVEKV